MNKTLQAKRYYDAYEVDAIVEPVIKALLSAVTVKDSRKRERIIVEARKRLVDMIGYRHCR